MFEIESAPEYGVVSRYRWQPGHYVDLVPGIFNASLKVGRDAMLDDRGYDEVYDYPTFAYALAAVLEWAASGRRRPDGDASREYVAP